VLVTEKLRAPVVAAAVIVIFAVICVLLSTVVVFTVRPEPPTLTELTPVLKLVPVKITSRVCSRLALVGEIPVSVGVGGVLTVTVGLVPIAVSVPPLPSLLLVVNVLVPAELGAVTAVPPPPYVIVKTLLFPHCIGTEIVHGPVPVTEADPTDAQFVGEPLFAAETKPGFPEFVV